LVEIHEFDPLKIESARKKQKMDEIRMEELKQSLQKLDKDRSAIEDEINVLMEVTIKAT